MTKYLHRTIQLVTISLSLFSVVPHYAFSIRDYLLNTGSNMITGSAHYAWQCAKSNPETSAYLALSTATSLYMINKLNLFGGQTQSTTIESDGKATVVQQQGRGFLISCLLSVPVFLLNTAAWKLIFDGVKQSPDCIAIASQSAHAITEAGNRGFQALKELAKKHLPTLPQETPTLNDAWNESLAWHGDWTVAETTAQVTTALNNKVQLQGIAQNIRPLIVPQITKSSDTPFFTDISFASHLSPKQGFDSPLPLVHSTPTLPGALVNQILSSPR